MKIIYVSTLISKRKMNRIIENSRNKPLQSIQKFHRLICEGFAKNSLEVKTISSIPMSRRISNKMIWFEKNERQNGVEYSYLPFINIIVLRQLCLLFFTFIYIFKEVIKSKKNVIFICDILNTTISTVTLFMGKVFKIKCVAIVTDLPKDMEKNKKINEKFQSKYDAYIILTEDMNKVVNKENKPYVVIEGIADIEENEKRIKEKYIENVCMYAGGLYEKYGIKDLVKAFSELEDTNARLHIYGSGELEKYISEFPDERIKYFGVVTNDEIIKEEKKATLLINPRFTNEEYTRYSFPSKNIEYMSSGTPILTTRLPGMPKEYYNYIFTIDEESVKGIKKSMQYLFALSKDELRRKGIEAKKFIMENKNNVVQARKIKELCKKIIGENDE